MPWKIETPSFFYNWSNTAGLRGGIVATIHDKGGVTSACYMCMYVTKSDNMGHFCKISKQNIGAICQNSGSKLNEFENECRKLENG